MGTYTPGAPKQLGSFKATAGWEDLFAQRKIDQGNFYASKDNHYPTLTNDTRRINWGWATVPPQSAQTLPREITFNAATHTLQQYPITEIDQLRGEAASQGDLKLSANKAQVVPHMASVARQSDMVFSFDITDKKAATFTAVVGSVTCTIQYTPPSTEVAGQYFENPVACGRAKDSLRLLPSETSIELRVVADWTFLEVYFQKGRVAMTQTCTLAADTTVSLTATIDTTAATVGYPMRAIWTTPDAVRSAPRVYH